ncbi:MAG TPA: vanadium-dependent haloperoxidase [Gaiellaceae bacterium]|nr:vanadium-dependent haloperoxidase [Gaiellaceae bacterium]
MRYRGLAGVGAIAVVAAIAAVNVQAHRGESTANVLQWYDLTAQSVAAAGLPEQVSQERIWAVAWLAAARATQADQGLQYRDAAFASALHDTLVSLVPVEASEVDAQLAASLAAIPAGRQKDRGVAAGQAEAQRALAERASDGLDTASVDRAWTAPVAAPGVYQLTGGPAVRAGLADAKPFLLRSKDQFDPGPPPSLTSSRYLDSLAEVHALGGAASAARTAAQTDTARFWAQSSLVTYTQVLRQVLAATDHSLAWQARLVAGFHVIQIDQQIAIHAAKYRYVFWRPVTAIQTGSVDPDPSWTPLISTPRHPEYPSGHAGYGGTAEVVLRALASPKPQSAVSASSATDGGAVHSWTSWTAITNETIDARVWEGVHFRFSDNVGAQLGREVAAYDLKRLDQLGL